MTNFLPAGIINENLEEILKRIDSLRELAHNCSTDIQQELQVLERLVLELNLFIGSFSCQPLIYTGAGRGVAQLAEHWSPKPGAGGSRPLSPAICF
jgi:hypothetical protein